MSDRMAQWPLAVAAGWKHTQNFTAFEVSQRPKALGYSSASLSAKAFQGFYCGFCVCVHGECVWVCLYMHMLVQRLEVFFDVFLRCHPPFAI